MNLFLRKTGGQGITLQGKVAASELPEDLACKVEETLTPEKLKKAQQAPKNTRMVDAQLYELILLDASETEATTFAFSEAQDIPELLDVLDELMGEIIRRKLEQRKKTDAEKD